MRRRSKAERCCQLVTPSWITEAAPLVTQEQVMGRITHYGFVFGVPEPNAVGCARSRRRWQRVCGQYSRRERVVSWRRGEGHGTGRTSVGPRCEYAGGAPRRRPPDEASRGRQQPPLRRDRWFGKNSASELRRNGAAAVASAKRWRRVVGTDDDPIPDGINLRALFIVLCLFGLFMLSTWSPNRRLAMLGMLLSFTIIVSFLITSGRQVAGGRLDQAIPGRVGSRYGFSMERLALWLSWGGGTNLLLQQRQQVAQGNYRYRAEPPEASLQPTYWHDETGDAHDAADPCPNASQEAFFATPSQRSSNGRRTVSGVNARRLRPGPEHDVLPFESHAPSRDLFASHRREWRETLAHEDPFDSAPWTCDSTQPDVSGAQDDIFDEEPEHVFFDEQSNLETPQDPNPMSSPVDTVDKRTGYSLMKAASEKRAKESSSIAIVPVEIIDADEDPFRLEDTPDPQWIRSKGQVEPWYSDTAVFTADDSTTNQGASRTPGEAFPSEKYSRTAGAPWFKEAPDADMIAAEEVYFASKPQRLYSKTGRSGLLRSLFVPLWQISRLALRDLQTKRGTVTTSRPSAVSSGVRRGNIAPFDEETNAFHAEGFDTPATGDDVFQGAARWVSRSAPGLWRTLFGP